MKILFETERINFCEAEENDIERIMKIENHLDNRNFIWQESKEQHLTQMKDDSIILMVFREKRINEVVGFALCIITDQYDIFELRRIAVTKKSLGYGREALVAIIKYSFEKLNTNRFWLDVYPENTIGIKLYESIGMHLDGIIRQTYKDHRGYLDQRIYSIIRSEYEK